MDKQAIYFASFGSVVLDEIRFPNQEPLMNVLGGSGAYATLGARLFLSPPLSRSLAWPIHVGNDFPDSISNLLQSWDIELVVERSSDRDSTRGLLVYQDTTFGPKKFKYTTPLILTKEEKLHGNIVLSSKSFHYLASPADLKSRVLKLLAIRAHMGVLHRPLIVWEPSPLTSNPDNLQVCLDVAKLVDVFSPNHLELAATFGVSYSVETQKSEIETLAVKVLSSGVGPDGNGVLVIRAGENGCLVQSRDIAPIWLPPFYTVQMKDEPASEVVDPTGAGNAFLGAYSIGYLETGDAVEAAYYGSVAASFALEQVGMPRKSNEGQEELWNGASVRERLDQYRHRQRSTE